MATIDDFGNTADPLSAPVFGGPSGWAAAVRDAINSLQSSDSSHVAASDPHTQYQRESERAAANGYASLGSDTKVPIAQVPTGTSGTTVAFGNHAHTGVYWTKWTGTQAAYDAIGTKDANTLYVIVG